MACVRSRLQAGLRSGPVSDRTREFRLSTQGYSGGMEGCIVQSFLYNCLHLEVRLYLHNNVSVEPIHLKCLLAVPDEKPARI
jgi:hypothetical protein